MTLQEGKWYAVFMNLFGSLHRSLFFRLYLFIFRERAREKGREGNIKVWLSLVHPLLGTWPAAQACALTGNRTSDLLVHRPALNPLSHTSQGSFVHNHLFSTELGFSFIVITFQLYVLEAQVSVFKN